MTYKQVAREQRYQISALMKAGLYQTEIAKIVGVHKSTISREFGGQYIELSRSPGEFKLQVHHEPLSRIFHLESDSRDIYEVDCLTF